MAAVIRVTLDPVTVPNTAADKNVAKDFSCVRIFSEFHILIEVFIVHILGLYFPCVSCLPYKPFLSLASV